MRPAAWFCLYLFGITGDLSAQQTRQDTAYSDLETVLISFNQWEQKRNEVPNRIVKVDLRDNILRNPQTVADMLGQSANVFIQKSQQAGGSPMIRGFAANRVLIVSDGVRMNNAIFRSGNLQNIISIDPQTVENAEIILGPGTIRYGSDAIGGVMDFHTMTPRFSSNDSILAKGHVMLRHSTANREQTIHADLNLGGKKWSWLGSFSRSDFNDLRMGRYGGQDRYLSTRYVSQINGRDSVIVNQDPRVQRYTGYQQVNTLQKVRFRPNRFTELHYSFTRAQTGDAPRYDRLIQQRQGRPRFAEWNYAPMVWQMHRLQWLHQRKTNLYDRSRIIVALQDYREGRYDRTLNSSIRNRTGENLTGWHLHWDNLKNLRNGSIHYGLEWVHDRVNSTAFSEDIRSGLKSPRQSRYPNGSMTMNTGWYVSYKRSSKDRVFISSGIRLNHGLLQARFDTGFIRWPFQEARISAGTITGNLGISLLTGAAGSVHANISTGFRMPNIDDLGKTFESTPGRLTVPNAGLRPEYAYHAEIGFDQKLTERIRVEGGFFMTWLDDAIVRRPFTFNGLDTIDFQGNRLAIEALRNAAFAHVRGFELTALFQILSRLTFRTGGIYTRGWETDDAKDMRVPLRHAPPLQGFAELKYNRERVRAELVWNANGKIRASEMPPVEGAKPEIYALDADGRPFSPAWHTLGFRCAYMFDRGLTITAGCENISDQRYKSYSSGIAAAGRNFIVSLRYGF